MSTIRPSLKPSCSSGAHTKPESTASIVPTGDSPLYAKEKHKYSSKRNYIFKPFWLVFRYHPFKYAKESSFTNIETSSACFGTAKCENECNFLGCTDVAISSTLMKPRPFVSDEKRADEQTTRTQEMQKIVALQIKR